MQLLTSLSSLLKTSCESFEFFCPHTKNYTIQHFNFPQAAFKDLSLFFSKIKNIEENYSFSNSAPPWSLKNLIINNELKSISIIRDSFNEIVGVSCSRPYEAILSENFPQGHILLARSYSRSLILPIINSLVLRLQLLQQQAPFYISLNHHNHRVFENYYQKLKNRNPNRCSPLEKIVIENISCFHVLGQVQFNYIEQLVLQAFTAKVDDLEVYRT